MVRDFNAEIKTLEDQIAQLRMEEARMQDIPAILKGSGVRVACTVIETTPDIPGLFIIAKEGYSNGIFATLRRGRMAGMDIHVDGVQQMLSLPCLCCVSGWDHRVEADEKSTGIHNVLSYGDHPFSTMNHPLSKFNIVNICYLDEFSLGAIKVRRRR